MKSVSYYTPTLLDCANCTSEVYLCVNAALTVSTKPYIVANIAFIDTQINCDGRTVYVYAFTYDENQLVPIDPVTPTILTTCDIKGVICKGCLTDFILAQVGGGASTCGVNNTVSTDSVNSVIVCGELNTIDTQGRDDFIGAGSNNKITGTLSPLNTPNMHGVVSGNGNTISGGNSSGVLAGSDNSLSVTSNSTIVAGAANQIIPDTVLGTYNSRTFIGAGDSNTIKGQANAAGILAGTSNFIFNSWYSFIGGGHTNSIEASTVGSESIIKSYNSIVGGQLNRIYDSEQSFVGGGNTNLIYSGSKWSSILGGFNTLMIGVRGSSILGGGCLTLGTESCGYQSLVSLGNVTLGTPRRDLSAFSGIAYFGDTDIWAANTDSVARKTKLFSPNADLTFASAKYSSFESPAQAANIEYVLPDVAGIVGQSLKITNVLGMVVTLGWA